MLKMLALALAVLAAQAVDTVRGRITLRSIGSTRNRDGHALIQHHNASEHWPRTPDFFTMDAEKMPEVPNVELSDGHSCHPQCWWDCGLPAKCETKCKPTCSPPKCVTTCEKQSMTGCSRLCEDPQCAVICPNSCSTGGCPECTTTCNKPKCSLDCGRKCSSQCDDPICAWHCQVGDNCQAEKPICKMKCEKPAMCTSFKGRDNRLIDIYRGFGDPSEEKVAVYGVKETVRVDFAKVPPGHLTGLNGAPMTGAPPMGPPLPMESAAPPKPPEEAKPDEKKAPWTPGAGAGPPPKPCKEEEADVASQIKWVAPTDEPEPEQSDA